MLIRPLAASCVTAGSLLLVGAALGAEPAADRTAKKSPSPEFRLWTDSTGKHQTEAVFLDYENGKVRLRKTDFRVVRIPIEKLSPRDRRWVKQRTIGTYRIPSQGRGLFITALCGRGCQSPQAACNVYVLNERQYQQHLGVKGSQLEPKGETPLLLSDVEPGIYHVAVEAAIDESVVPMKGGSGPNPLQPDCQGFFLDDLPDVAVHIARSAAAPSESAAHRMRCSWRKWYKISVGEDRVSPVVALFLDKAGSLSTWKESYPKSERFAISLSAEAQEGFWGQLRSMVGGSGLTPQQQKHLTTLLKRGGRVCLPGVSIPTVVWIDGDGLPMVALKAVGKNAQLAGGSPGQLAEKDDQNNPMPAPAGDKQDQSKPGDMVAATEIFVSKGDAVIVSNDGTRLLMGGKILAELKMGAKIEVVKVTNDRVGGHVTVDGKRQAGWVKKSEVFDPSTAFPVCRHIFLQKDAGKRGISVDRAGGTVATDANAYAKTDVSLKETDIPTLLARSARLGKRATRRVVGPTANAATTGRHYFWLGVYVKDGAVAAALIREIREQLGLEPPLQLNLWEDPNHDVYVDVQEETPRSKTHDE